MELFYSSRWIVECVGLCLRMWMSGQGKWRIMWRFGWSVDVVDMKVELLMFMEKGKMWKRRE